MIAALIKVADGQTFWTKPWRSKSFHSPCAGPWESITCPARTSRPKSVP